MTADSIVLELLRLQDLLRVTLDKATREAGLGKSEYVVLRALARTPGLSGAELAREAKVTPQSMHGVLVRLQRDGVIEPGPHPTDKRLRVYSLTAGGQTEADADAGRVADIEAKLTAALAEGERARLASAVRECTAAVEGLGPRATTDAPSVP